MIYPSGRAVWAGAIAVLPAFAVAVALPSYWYVGLILICALLSFVAVDASAGPGRASLRATLQSPARVGVGGEFTVRIVAGFAGRSPRSLEARLAHDDRIEPVGPTGGELLMHAGQWFLELRFRARRRGMAGLDRLWLRWPGPFGLSWKQAVLPMDNRIEVVPDVWSAREQAIRLLQRDALPEGQEQNRAGQGREFESLKDFQPGMERRMIDWKRSARHGKLVAREFRIEQNNSIVLAIDSGRLMCEPIDGLSKLDRAVTAALLSAFIALKGGDMVNLVSFDARPRITSGAVRGTAGFGVIQQRAAEIDYSSEETNFTLAMTTLAARLDRRSLVIVFTDFVDTISAELMLRTVGQLTERHLVLFMMMKDVELERLCDAEPAGAEDVARAVVAGGLLRERQVVIGRLRRLGARVIEADHAALGPDLVQQYLELKREALL